MTVTQQKQLTRIDPATDHIRGPLAADVTIVEYADFASEACAEAHVSLQMLLTAYGKEVNLVFRHFPERAIHPYAELAAEAAEAMAAQGRFWAFHDLLFTHQGHLSESRIREDAASLEADLQRFDAALHEHVYLQRVQEHMAGARLLGIRAMPTLFVNGALVDVSFGLHHLAEAVEAALRAVDEQAAARAMPHR